MALSDPIRVFLIRHAKSSWKHEDLADIDRPLNKRGKRDAPEMGRRLRNQGVQPSLLISSPAVRALSTATLISQQIERDPDDIQIDETLYGGSVDDVLAILRQIPNGAEDVLLFFHNPTITDFANRFGGRHIENVPTCGIVTYEWHVLRQEPVFLNFDYPKSI